jgi:outer membrane protein OmpA-like peptidoglycan-associated protein
LRACCNQPRGEHRLCEAARRERIEARAGFASGALIGGAAAGPIGMVVGAGVGAVMGDRSHKKSEAIAARRAEAALLASELESRDNSLADIETKAGEVGSTVQFRTGQTAVRDSDRARIAKLGALVAHLKDVRVRVSGFADSRGNEELNLSLSQERAEMVALELEKPACPRNA